MSELERWRRIAKSRGGDVSLEAACNENERLRASEAYMASKLEQTLVIEGELRQRIAELESALREISKGEGRYDTDPLKHCGNTVEDMIGLAKKALKEGDDGR